MSANNVIQIREALNQTDLERARELLREALKDQPSAEHYVLAARAALNDQQRIQFLEKAVELDPFNAEANADLERLKKTAVPSVPATRPSPSTRSELMRGAIQRFSMNEWRLMLDTGNTVRFEKRKGANPWAEIGLVVILNGLGLIIVLLNRYARKRESVTLENEGDTLRVISQNLYSSISDASQVMSIVESVVTPINIWVVIGIWFVREIIAYILLS